MGAINSLDAFLEWEDAEGAQHEFVGGTVCPVAPDSIAKNIIKGNVFAALQTGCNQKSCRVFVTAMRVITPAGDVLYPEIAIGPPDVPIATKCLNDPYAIVEIRPFDAEQGDRRLCAYRSIASVRRCVLIAEDRRMVRVFAREGQDWTCTTIEGPHAIVSFGTLGVTLYLADVYAGLDG